MKENHASCQFHVATSIITVELSTENLFICYVNNVVVVVVYIFGTG
jgi:hypothetical protein